VSAISMLFGAALVAIGVIAAGLADRIRGLRITRDRAAPPRNVEPQKLTPKYPAQDVAAPLPKPTREPATKPATRFDGDRLHLATVIAALTTAGYRKATATEAAEACSSVDRSTLEGWTRAALSNAQRQ
jgi:hypothetical protein